MRTYFRLLGYARPFGRYAAPYFFFALLSTVFGLANLTLIIPLLDVLFGTVPPQPPVAPPPFAFDGDFVRDTFNYYLGQMVATRGKAGALQFVSLVIIVSVLLANVFRYLAQRVIETARMRLIYNLRQAAFDQSLALDLAYFTHERKGHLMARLTTDMMEVEGAIASTFKAVFREPFALIGYFVVLFAISAQLTFFTILVLPVSGLAIGAIVRRLRRDAQRGQESLGDLTALMDEAFGGLRIVKAFSAEGYLRRKFADENARYVHFIRSMSVKRELAPPVSEFLGVTVVAIILLYGGSLVLREDSSLTASAFIGYLAIFSQVMQPAKAIAQAFSQIQRGLVAGERALEVVDARPQIRERAHAQALAQFESELRFEDVRFAYGERPVLDGISFSLPKGKTIALVGPSGGGKSTIADLIPRFYDPQGGAITLDGTDIRDLTLTSLRAQLGIVAQESILFNDTIFHNIAFGKPEATREEVQRAAEIAFAHDFIVATEQGYDTVIGERGTRLSGGQRQRLSIARAILKNPPILILDEATSALDPESEQMVQAALLNLMQHRTVLVIAHRLSTIRHADEILVVEGGRIVERGTHDTLSEQSGGVYHKLRSIQQA